MQTMFVILKVLSAIGKPKIKDIPVGQGDSELYPLSYYRGNNHRFLLPAKWPAPVVRHPNCYSQAGPRKSGFTPSQAIVPKLLLSLLQHALPSASGS